MADAPVPTPGPSEKRRLPKPVLYGLLGLAVLLLIGAAILFNSAPSVAASENRLSELNGSNRELEDRIGRLKGDLQNAPDCPPGQVRKLEDGGLVVPPPSQTPAAPSTSKEPKSEGQLAVLSSDQLAQKLERATALVVTSKGIGTGFFISDRLLITNRHVVETADQGKLFIASRSLQNLRRGTVLQVTAASTPGAPDFALVRLDDGTAPDRLDVTRQVKKLSSVVAAGYPGIIVLDDTGFRRLINGDVKTAPDLNLTQGAVQSLQSSSEGLPVIIHTASIMEGNSGGPLVDACGRALGVNTYIKVDQKQSGRVSFAQAADALVDFMKPFGGGLVPDERECK